MYGLKNSFLYKFIYQQVINEADPELKGTRRLLSKQKQPTLSEVSLIWNKLYMSIVCYQIIREAKTDKDTQTSVTKNEMATFLQLFEKHQGKI